MKEPARLSPEDVRQSVSSGSALLVCAYRDDAKFRLIHLEGAIPLHEFEARLSSLPKEQEIVFY